MGLKAFGVVLLAALVAGSAYVALLLSPERVPEPGMETTSWLAAMSLAAEGDLAVDDVDRERFRERFGELPRDVRLRPRTATLAAPPLAARAWAMGERIWPRRGPLLVNWIGWCVALGLALWALGPTLGGSTALWLALLGYGSIAWKLAFGLQAEVLALPAAVLAATLVWGRRTPPATAEQIYGGERPAAAALWRWPLAGLALGAVAVRSPAYLALALPMAYDLPRAPGPGASGRRAAAAALFALGLALPIGFVFAVDGSPWPLPTLRFSPALFGWNTLDFFVGSSAGALLWFSPAIAVLLFSRRWGKAGEGRALLPYAVLAAVVVHLQLTPFDWPGERWTSGDAWFLPLYGALWFALDVGAARRAALATALCLVVATPWLLPHWLAPTAARPVAPGAVARVLAPLARTATLESALRSVPGAVERRRGGALLRGDERTVRATAKGLTWIDGRVLTLLLASDRPLAAATFELGDGAPSEIEVGGGEAGNTTFRPSGEVALEVALPRAARRHPLWWTGEPGSIYRLTLSMPKPPAKPLVLDLVAVRPREEAAP